MSLWSIQRAFGFEKSQSSNVSPEDDMHRFLGTLIHCQLFHVCGMERGSEPGKTLLVARSRRMSVGRHFGAESTGIGQAITYCMVHQTQFFKTSCPIYCYFLFWIWIEIYDMRSLELIWYVPHAQQLFMPDLWISEYINSGKEIIIGFGP